MSCAGRVYKGDEWTLVLPFSVSGATDIMVSIYTDGEYEVQKSGVAEDGQIVVVLESADLDILSDGAIRYTITYEVDGEEHSDTSSTLYYLKTPAGYSAVTADVIYQSGYTAGQADCPECSGSTEGGRFAVAVGSFNIPTDVAVEGNVATSFLFHNMDAGVTKLDGGSYIIPYDTVITSGRHSFRTDIWNGIGEVPSYPIQAVGIGNYTPEDLNLTYTIWLNTTK